MENEQSNENGDYMKEGVATMYIDRLNAKGNRTHPKYVERIQKPLMEW